MQFALLFYRDETTPGTEEEKRARRESMESVVLAASEAGALAAVARLQPTPKARTGRMTPQGPAFTDGPFAETKEQLGGLCVVDCANEGEAREWAARFLRTGCLGAVEVRPLARVPQPGERARERESAAI